MKRAAVEMGCSSSSPVSHLFPPSSSSPPRSFSSSRFLALLSAPPRVLDVRSLFLDPYRRLPMIACSSGPLCPFTRGVTYAGEEVLICTWQNMAPLVQQQGRWLRAYCPVHESDHQRSLSINAENGWGCCFRCQVRVLVQDLNPQVATRLLQRVHEAPSPLAPVQPVRLPVSPQLSRPQPEPSSQEGWQAEECQVLSDLHDRGALRLDRDAAWNAHAYLAARHIPLDVALATRVGYLEQGASQRYQ